MRGDGASFPWRRWLGLDHVPARDRRRRFPSVRRLREGFDILRRPWLQPRLPKLLEASITVFFSQLELRVCGPTVAPRSLEQLSGFEEMNLGRGETRFRDRQAIREKFYRNLISLREPSSPRARSTSSERECNKKKEKKNYEKIKARTQVKKHNRRSRIT